MPRQPPHLHVTLGERPIWLPVGQELVLQNVEGKLVITLRPPPDCGMERLIQKTFAGHDVRLVVETGEEPTEG